MSNCICFLKTNHDCPEKLDSYEKQHAEIYPKLKFEKDKIHTDHIQSEIAEDIAETENFIERYHNHNLQRFYSQDEIIKFNGIISYFPEEFTKEEKSFMYDFVIKIISKSRKYFVKNGRITSLE